MIVFLSACGDIEQSLSKTSADNNANQSESSDNSGNNQSGQGTGGSDNTDNSGSSDNTGGNNDTGTNPENPNDESGDTVNPDKDNQGGTVTEPGEEGGSDNQGGEVVEPNPDKDNQGGTVTEPGEEGGDGNGSEAVDPVDPDKDDESSTTNPDYNEKPAYDKEFNALADVFESKYYYGRSFLNENEQEVYDHILQKLIEFEVTDENKDKYLICVPLYNDGVKIEYTSDILQKLAKITGYIAYDEQRITYLYSVAPKGSSGTRLEYTYSSSDRKYYTKEVCFNVRNVNGGDLYSAKLIDTKNKYTEEMQQVEEGVVKILSKLKADMTDAQKFRVLHDEFLKLVSYGQKDEGTGDIRGGFLYNKVFCEGYARSLAYLCQRAGLECIYVVGTASYTGNGDGGSGEAFDHAWIKVKLDDKWYNVDPTNNDSLNPNSDGIVYNDFLLSDSDFNNDHEAGWTAGVTGVRQQTSYPSFPEANESMDIKLTEYSNN